MTPGFVSPEVHYLDLERGHPETIIGWASETIERLAVATSFQSSGLVILDIIRRLRPQVPVLFLETGFHFPETLVFRTRITREWGLNLVDVRGDHGSAEGQARTYGDRLYERDPDKCCFINKVEPLQRALEDYDGWISGIRRDQSPLRADTPIVEAQMLPSGTEVLKIHPLANWTKADVARYVSEREIPTHPLLERGFASIGCAPCTRAIAAWEDERAGRWNGFDKTECGIHSFGREHGPRATEAEQ